MEKMEDNLDVKSNAALKSAFEDKEIKEVASMQVLYNTGTYEEIEKDINAKILAITLKISKERPELSKFLDEMPLTVPNNKEPHITLNLLKVYYDSLRSLFAEYDIEHIKKD